MTANAFDLIVAKCEVTERLHISERTLEKLVRARRFPPPLRLGKLAMWDESVVAAWLDKAVAEQREWRPRQRGSGTDTAGVSAV